MQFRDFLAILGARWRTVAVTMLLVLAAAVLTTLQMPRVYEAKARVFMAASTAPDGRGGYVLTSSDLTTYVELLNSPVVLDPLRKTLGVEPGTPLQVSAGVSAATPVLDVTVQAGTAQLAADAANAVGPELAKVGGAYAPLLANSGQGVRATAISPAAVPSAPVSPDVARNVLLGLLAGLGLGIGLALLKHFLDTRVRTEADVQAVSDRPILGSLRVLPKSDEAQLVVQTDPQGLAAEEYRRLRTNLQFADITTGGQHSFAISSAMPSEGKTTTAINLALAMADAGARVLLVDADLRHPSVAKQLGIEGQVGLTTVLLGRTTVEDAAQRWGETGLYVLPSGAIPPNPSELLGSAAMETLFAQLLDSFDFVLVDTPPIIPVSDPVLIDRLVGGMLIVVAADRTLKRDLTQAVRSLKVVDARVAGFALNMVQNSEASSRYGAYYDSSRAKRKSRVKRSDDSAATTAGELPAAPVRAITPPTSASPETPPPARTPAPIAAPVAPGSPKPPAGTPSTPEPDASATVWAGDPSMEFGAAEPPAPTSSGSGSTKEGRRFAR